MFNAIIDFTRVAATHQTGAWGARVPETVQALSRGKTACFWMDTQPSDGRRVALCDIAKSAGAAPRDTEGLSA